MPATLVGEVKRITYESEESSFRVLKVQLASGEDVTAVGRIQFVAVGTPVHLCGEFHTDPTRGRQFRVHTLIPIEPTTLVGIERYLGSGLIPGLGKATAKKIVTHFGLETLNVLNEAPERLKEVSGLGASRRESLIAGWSAERENNHLAVLLGKHGIGGQLARRIKERYGERTAEVLQTQPYRLAMEVRGVGFKTADNIAQGLGLNSDHPDRVRAGVLHVLTDAGERGHVFLPQREVLDLATHTLGVDASHVEAGIATLWAQGRLVVEGEAIFLSSKHMTELGIAQEFARLFSHELVPLPGAEEAIRHFEEAGGVQLASQQREAIESAACNQCLVVTGGPGVGKTTIVRAIASVMKSGGLRVQLAAPTGRAAKRLAESTGLSASTLHRVLEFEPKRRGFKRDAAYPLEIDVLIVDEASMIDQSLALHMLRALPGGVRLVLVGDVDQLPSVGAGAFLRDVINSGVLPVVRLDQVFRQAEESWIVRNAHRILQGLLPESGTAGSSADFFVIERKDAASASATIGELVCDRIPSRFGLDAKQDIQVLCPMHRGQSGTETLNQQLQERLNPTGLGVRHKAHEYRVGDRILQLRNDYDRQIFNGDLGHVVSVAPDAHSLQAVFDGRVVDVQGQDFESIALAYATSIHKSQGSEFPAVVIPFLAQHYVMLTRNLLYTAVTRARKLCVLVADPRAVKLALSEARSEERHTRLSQRLCAALESPAA